jgi:hypothetical protein
MNSHEYVKKANFTMEGGFVTHKAQSSPILFLCHFYSLY